MSPGPRMGRLPLFPLAQVALFPRTRVPLRVFEPRYRQLVAHVLDGDRRIGMIAVPPEHAASLAGDPPLYAVGCAGVITEVERLRDGRYELMLAGVERFRVRRETERPSERLYRVAEVELIGDGALDSNPTQVAALRGSAVELVEAVLARGSSVAKGRSSLGRRLAALDDATFTDALCQALGFTTPEKQGLLEAEGVGRLDGLVALLRFRLADATAPAATRTLH